MSAMTRPRTILTDNADLRKEILDIKLRLNTHDQQIHVAFAAMKGLLQPKPVQPAHTTTDQGIFT
jgi:hypothetical protein